MVIKTKNYTVIIHEPTISEEETNEKLERIGRLISEAYMRELKQARKNE